jgi:hypothetical protein
MVSEHLIFLIDGINFSVSLFIKNTDLSINLVFFLLTKKFIAENLK